MTGREYNLRLKVLSAYVCADDCPGLRFLNPRHESATARCDVFSQDVTVIPPGNTPMRTTGCIRFGSWIEKQEAAG